MNILRPRLHLKHHEFQLRQDMEIDLEYAKEPLGETAVIAAAEDESAFEAYRNDSYAREGE